MPESVSRRQSIDLDQVAEHWNENADLWSEQVRRGWDAYREHLNNPAFFRFVGDLKGKLVLDAGCGEGYNTRHFARLGAQMVGVDLSSRMIDLARQEEEREPLGIRYEVASFTNLSLFPSSTFEAIVSTMALMDSPDFAGTARELFRVLRPGGELCFSVTHPCFLPSSFHWLQNEQGEAVELVLADYFDTSPMVQRWRFKDVPSDVPPFELPAFFRTLSEYFNGLIQAGFVLREVREPRPSHETCQKHPWLRRWRDHAAIFLHIRAARPAES
jgi:SAM-dependent methyltransferase